MQAQLALELFGAAQVERARRYHRLLYRVLVANTAVGLAVLATLAFVGPELGGWPWAGRAAALAAIAVVAPALARLPLSFLAGHLRERRHGFSTQTARAWLADRAKGVAVALALTVPLLVGLVGLARALPRLWPLPAAGSVALAVLLVGFASPVVIEPLFNRFAPLADEALAADLRALAARAETPVRDVLVADASRRTRRTNAYVSGLGATRRLVLYDTLLERAPAAETRVVVAHELGHRRARHLLQGTVLGMVGAAAGVVALWGLLRWPALLHAVGASGPGDPRAVPVALLALPVFELAGLPIAAAIGRRWEREADAASLELTGDPTAFEAAHRRIAIANLADLAPPRLAYVLLFSHPTQPERIAFGRCWSARGHGVEGA